MEPLVEKFRAKNKEDALEYNDQPNIATIQYNGKLLVSAVVYWRTKPTNGINKEPDWWPLF